MTAVDNVPSGSLVNIGQEVKKNLGKILGFSWDSPGIGFSISSGSGRELKADS